MRNICSLLLSLLFTGSIFAQSTFQTIISGAEATPPNNSRITGDGQFSLAGNSLTYAVNLTPSTGDVFLAGPGPRGEIGPNIAQLFLLAIEAPDGSGRGPWFYYSGSVNLTSPQIDQLQEGLLYINVTSEAFPNGEVRGQITAVPEASSLSLLAFGVFAYGFFLKYKRANIS